MSDLRERVAKHVFLALQTERDTANKWETSDPETQRTWRIIANAAIALVLEEAARVAGDFPAYRHGNLAAHPFAAAQQASDEIAAAIRALKGDGE